MWVFLRWKIKNSKDDAKNIVNERNNSCYVILMEMKKRKKTEIIIFEKWNLIKDDSLMKDCVMSAGSRKWWNRLKFCGRLRDFFGNEFRVEKIVFVLNNLMKLRRFWMLWIVKNAQKFLGRKKRLENLLDTLTFICMKLKQAKLKEYLLWF